MTGPVEGVPAEAVEAPRVCTLYRFWAIDPTSNPPEQEWEGWWDGRNWHALYDHGVWDREFVVRWEPLLPALIANAKADALREAAPMIVGMGQHHGGCRFPDDDFECKCGLMEARVSAYHWLIRHADRIEAES